MSSNFEPMIVAAGGRAMAQTLTNGDEDNGGLDRLHEAIRKCAELKFGPLPPEFVNRVNAITEDARLRDILTQVVRVSRLEDVHT
jgi:hypothetical protein